MLKLQTTRRGQFLRGLVIAIVGLTCLKVWFGPAPLVSEVHAQIPDSGLQRKQQIDEARRTNELLADIKKLLEQGTLNVRIQGADNQASAPKLPPAGP